MKSHHVGKAFRCALQGIVSALRSERNMRVHVIAAILVFCLGYWTQLSGVEWMILLLTVAAVLAAELFNTALEKTVDLISPDFHPLAKIAKDTAAGAVLVASVAAALIGYLLFFDKIFR